MINRIGVLSHPKIVETGEVADLVESRLHEWGVQVYRASTWDTPSIEAIIDKLELLVVLGGDGSTLRAARIASAHNVMVTSINMGRLGFLSEMQPDDWQGPLHRMVDGDFWVEERMMLRTEAFRDGQSLGVIRRA